MSKAILLDTHPLSAVTHPKADPKIRQWLQSLVNTNTVIRIPEIADYELRRELLRSNKTKSIERLNEFSEDYLIPLDSETMRKAAEIWAWVRNQGKPTANDYALDGDVILAAQAILQLSNFSDVEIITTNVKHLSRFESQGIIVVDWQKNVDNFI